MPLHIKGLDFVKVKKDCEDYHLKKRVQELKNGDCYGDPFFIELTCS